MYHSGSQTFLKFRLCGLQEFFSIIHGALFLSINFHAKSSEKQKKGHHFRRCPIFHAKSREEEQKRSSRPQMSNQAQFNGMIYQNSAHTRPLCGPPKAASRTFRGPRFPV